MTDIKLWPRQFLLGLIPFLVAFELLVWPMSVQQGLGGVADFRQLYAGAYMLRTLPRAELYNYELQLDVQQHLVPLRHHFGLVISHPAYEELFLVPLSFLSYRHAYLSFFVINLFMLGLSIKLLMPLLGELSRTWRLLPLFLFATYFPVTRAITQGQDSIILLAILTGVLVSLIGARDLRAGLLMGLGMFKFTIVLPIFVLFLCWKRWRFAAGFALSSSLAVLTSILTTGLQGFTQYFGLLREMIWVQPGTWKYTEGASIMLNLRGVVAMLLDKHLAHGIVLLIVSLGSVVVLMLARQSAPSFSLAISSACLVSYQFIAHDASVLLIPILIALCTKSRWLAAAAVAMFVMPNTSIHPAYGYLAGIPLITLFIAYCAVGTPPIEFPAWSRIGIPTSRISKQAHRIVISFQ